jgi:hypothetical protein
MPLLFSYGTLQEEDVQRSTFGRPLQGQPDELPGSELSSIPIRDPRVVAATGLTCYANVILNGRGDSRVRGTVYEVTDADLAASDQYEQDADYHRVVVTLASGKQAWVYLNDRPVPGAG